MGRWRRAMLAVMALSSGATLAMACSSFGSSNDAPPADSGPADSAADDAGDAGSTLTDAATVRFCAQQSATAILCDDFEENDGGVLSVWKPTTRDGGAVVAAAAPLRDGHAAKFTASGAGAEVALGFAFDAATAIAGVVFDVDMLIDTAGYDYIELCELNTAGADAAYFGGVAKGGAKLGRHFTPQAGPTIPIDSAWHHIHIELARAASGFSQTVTIDGTVQLEQTANDLSTMSFAQLRLGIMSPLAPGQQLAVIYFDNVLLRSP